jgi:hypothetical protein
MAPVRVQPFWQQKHPTPAHRGWDFHWVPAELPALVKGGPRAPAGAAVCLIGGGQVAWARTFSAFVPSEQRHYVGLAGVVAGPVAADAIPHVLEQLRLPRAEPYGEQSLLPSPLQARPLAMAPVAPALLDALLPARPEARRELVQAVCQGGEVALAAPCDERAPELIGRVLSWLPPSDLERERAIVLVPADRAAAAVSTPPELGNLHHYLACAMASRDPYPAAAWTLVHDLARAQGVGLADLFGELTRVANAWDAAPALRRYLLDSGALRPDEVARCDARAPAPLFADDVVDAGWLWNRVVHYWGRGLLGEDDLVDRLVTVLARRIVVDHLFRLDHPEAVEMPWRHVRRLHFEALLGHGARTRMLETLAARLPLLSQRGAP